MAERQEIEIFHWEQLVEVAPRVKLHLFDKTLTFKDFATRMVVLAVHVNVISACEDEAILEVCALVSEPPEEVVLEKPKQPQA